MAEVNINPAYLQPGTKVGAYEVVNLVGHGGFGYLYRVTRDGTSYALKLSRWRLADMAPEDRSDTEDRLDREISALKSLRHPNIVRVHCFERWPGLDDYPYLLMDFVEGERLNDWRQKSSPSFRTICETISEIADAIGYMHRVGVFHRDIKSDNILVRISDGRPNIVDFGIARPVISRTVTRDCTTLGTDTHYAPEYAAWAMSQAFHDGDSFSWQPTTDLHSLGYMFYELVTGAAPFPRPKSGSNFTATLQTIQTFVPVKPSVRTQGRVPAVLDSIIMRLLAKDPADRYQKGEEVTADIRNALEKAGPEWDEPNAVAPGGPEKALTRKVGPESAKRSQTPNEVRKPVVDSALRQGTAQGEGDRKAPEVSAAVTVAPPKASSTTSDEISSRLLFPLIPKGESTAPDLSARRRIDDAAREMGDDAAGVPFNPPTTVRPSFTGIERKAASSPTPDPADVPLMATAIRQQAERLEQTGRRTRPNYIVVGGVLAGALLVVFFLVAALVGGSPREERHSDLIAAVEKQRQVEAASKPAAPTNPEVVAKPIQLGDDLGEKPATPSPAPSQVPVAVPPSAVPATYTPPRRMGRNKDASDIDESLRKNFGRPTVPPSDGAREQSSNDPAWLRRSVRVDKASTQVAVKGLGVPMGSHIRAKLLSNLDSRTINGAPVEVMLPTPFLVGDQVILPAGTLMYGDGSSSGSRFTIRFARIRLPDNSEVEFTGLALDRGDGKAGLRASRRITSEGDTGPGLGERVAKGAVSTVVGGVSVTGGLADDVAKGATTTAINNRDAVVATGENAILLDAPVLLDVFIMKSF